MPFEFRTGSDFPLQIFHVFIFIFNDMQMPKFILKGFTVHYTIYQQMNLFALKLFSACSALSREMAQKKETGTER